MDRFHDEQEGLDSEGYRAISKTSVIAFVLGLLSFTAPVFPAFWIFPLFGLVIASVALVRMNRSEFNLAGKGLAVTGLLLSLLFGSMGLSRHYGHKAILNSQAEEFGTLWFGLLSQGSMFKAHQLVMDPKQRVMAEVILSEQYKNDVKLQDALKEFTGEPFIQDVQSKKENVRFTLVKTLNHRRDQQTIYIRQIYDVSIQEGQTTRVFPIELKISCQFDRIAGQTYWVIADYMELDQVNNG